MWRVTETWGRKGSREKGKQMRTKLGAGLVLAATGGILKVVSNANVKLSPERGLVSIPIVSVVLDSVSVVLWIVSAVLLLRALLQWRRSRAAEREDS